MSYQRGISIAMFDCLRVALMNQKTPSDSFHPWVNCGLSWITVSYIITMVDKMGHLVFRRMAHLKSQENPFGSLLAHRRGTFGMSRCQFLACRRVTFGMSTFRFWLRSSPLLYFLIFKILDTAP